MKLQEGQARKVPEANFNMKLSTAIQGPKMPCRKIDVQGAKQGKYFEFPEVQQSAGELFCSADFKSRIMTKISACVGVGIYSIRLHFDDGTQSPILGSRTELTSDLQFGTDAVT
jgi:hypothetical protein